jgi:hypothetical protein
VVVGRRFEVFAKRVETLRGRVKWGDGLENGKGEGFPILVPQHHELRRF